MPPHIIRLRLNDIHDLFALPRHNPFQENYLPLSGVDQIVQQLKIADRLRHGLHVTFILPDTADRDPAIYLETQKALKRYCNIRLDSVLIELKARQHKAVNGLQAGMAILGLSLAIGAAVNHADGMAEWIRVLLSNSLTIFGSVALWSPTDTFLFGIRPLYAEIQIYYHIRDMTFDIEYEKPDALP